MQRYIFSWILLFAVAPFLAVLPAYSQIECPGVTGRLTSLEGWLITGASVRIVRKETGEEVKIETTSAGNYDVCVKPGRYDVLPRLPVSKKPKGHQ
jgi:hypothetical protein